MGPEPSPTDHSGMLQLGARFYWPEVGRFVQQDPVGRRLNRYAYVRGNPLVRVDPAGLQDIFLGLDAEAVLCGIGPEGGLGLVYDTDDPSASGFYGTFGPALGKNLGAGIVVGFALRDIEDISYNIDVNAGIFAGVLSFDAQGFNSVALGVGKGAGVSLSAMNTETYPFGKALLNAAAFLVGLVGPGPASPPTDPCE